MSEALAEYVLRKTTLAESELDRAHQYCDLKQIPRLDEDGSRLDLAHRLMHHFGDIQKQGRDQVRERLLSQLDAIDDDDHG